MNTYTDTSMAATGCCCNSSRTVSWGAILAGAVAAVSVTLILTLMGAGFGFSSVSPFARYGMSAGAFTASAAIWLIVVQWVASAFGGYFAGRLRCKWSDIHEHEAFFRDTAHGFVAWGISTIAVATVLASIMAGGARTAHMAMAHDMPPHGMMQPGMESGGPLGYYADGLYRGEQSSVSANAAEARREAAAILMTAAKDDGVSDDDKAYLAQNVSARTGLSQADAEKRVNDTIAKVNDATQKARTAMDDARKAAAKASVFACLALLIGAFIASVSAAIGGRHKEIYKI